MYWSLIAGSYGGFTIDSDDHSLSSSFYEVVQRLRYEIDLRIYRISVTSSSWDGNTIGIAGTSQGVMHCTYIYANTRAQISASQRKSLLVFHARHQTPGRYTVNRCSIPGSLHTRSSPPPHQPDAHLPPTAALHGSASSCTVRAFSWGAVGERC